MGAQTRRSHGRCGVVSEARRHGLRRVDDGALGRSGGEPLGGGGDVEFLKAKLVTARFYATQYSSLGLSYADTVTGWTRCWRWKSAISDECRYLVQRAEGPKNLDIR